MKNRILITGGTGLLGKAMIEKRDISDEILATYFGDYTIKDTGSIKYMNLNILDEAGYRRLFEAFIPTVVIHTVSVGSPDYAEKNRDITWKINVDGTKTIISLCKEFGSKFIYISSNGIYDGNNAPYSETDRADPINYYGYTKLEGERALEKSKITYAIVRPILMYGWHYSFERPNIVTLSLLRLSKNEKVFAYDDVYSNPLFSGSCAEAIWGIIKEGKYEAFNIAGKERVNVYGLVKKAAEIFGLDAGLIIPVKQGFFNEFVQRPKDTSYRTDKMEKMLNIKPLSLSDGLKIMRINQE